MPAYENLVVEVHMPNIENLRKQIIRWHRERHHPVAAIIRSYTPHLGDLTDMQILDRPFKLVDAQQVVAHREGFESWHALITGVELMTTNQSNQATRPSLIQAEPQLFVNDLDVALQYYQSALGFAVVFAYGEPPFYAQVARDGAKINLRVVGQPIFAAGIRESEQLLSASITVENIKELFLEYQGASALFVQTLHTEPWGARTFIVKDPHGNLILFAE